MSKTRFVINQKEFKAAIAAMYMTPDEMIQISGAGAKLMINRQRELCPVDTSATRNSIGSHIIEASDERVIDDVGPETAYAPYLEYGTGDFAESGNGRKGGWRYKDEKGNWHFTKGMRPQPFVRPSVGGTTGQKAIQGQITKAYRAKIRQKWPGASQ